MREECIQKLLQQNGIGFQIVEAILDITSESKRITKVIDETPTIRSPTYIDYSGGVVISGIDRNLFDEQVSSRVCLSSSAGIIATVLNLSI